MTSEGNGQTGALSADAAGASSNSASVKRVAVVLSQLRPGGMERVVVHLATGLAAGGIKPLVICLQGPGQLADSLTAAGVRVVALNSQRSFDMRAIWKLARILRRFDPSIINVHDYSSLPYVALANLLRVKRPIIFTAHGLLYKGFEKLRRRCRLASGRVAAITAVSSEVAARHSEYLTWSHEIDVVPNGVPEIVRSQDLRQQVRARLGLGDDCTVFLAMGNIRPEKGFQDLLAAANLLRSASGEANFAVLIAGGVSDKSYDTTLRKLHNLHNLEKTVRFLGFRDDTTALYSAADAFVLSSRSEGLPMVILEAMSASLPIIATRVGGVPNVISPDTGLLVDAASPEALADAMMQLLSSGVLREKLGAQAHQFAVANYGVGKMVSRYIETFERIFSSSSSRGRECCSRGKA